MIGYRNARVVTLCDHCARVIEGEPVHASDHSFCSNEHAVCWSPLPYRCPDCVTKGEQPCPHGRSDRGPDRDDAGRVA